MPSSSFASLLVSSRWMLRGMHRRVAVATRRVGVSLVFWGVFFGFGVINLAAFEFIVFSLMFAWLVVLTRQLGVPSDAPDPSIGPPAARPRRATPTAVTPSWTDVHVASAARALPTEAGAHAVHPSWRPAARPDRRRRAAHHAAGRAPSTRL